MPNISQISPGKASLCRANPFSGIGNPGKHHFQKTAFLALFLAIFCYCLVLDEYSGSVVECEQLEVHRSPQSSDSRLSSAWRGQQFCVPLLLLEEPFLATTFGAMLPDEILTCHRITSRHEIKE